MIKLKDKLLYATGGNFSNGVTLQALTSFLIFFGTSILGVSGTLIGLVVAISVVWDAISDPFIGHVSDFTSSKRFGRRHLYMIIGTIGLALTNAALWSINPQWSELQKGMAIFLGGVMLVKTFMTIYVTPYNALGGELSQDYYERNSIQAYRTIFFISGLAFTTVAGMLIYFRPTVDFDIGQLNPLAYRYLGFTISIMILICGAMAILGTFKFIGQLPKNTKTVHNTKLGPMIKEFKAVFSNKNYLYVAGGAYLSANLATAIVGAIGLHVFTYTFGMDNYGIGIMFGLIFGLSIVSQAFYIDITKKYDKKTAALLAAKISLLGGAVIFLILIIYRASVVKDFWWLILYAIPSGIGLGGLITLPFSMIADTVDEEELMTGHRSEGLYYGGLTFSYKISQSIAIFLVGIILDFVGFDSSVQVQAPSTALWLGLIVAIGAILALLGAIGFYKRYALTKERIDEIKIQISENKKAC